VNVKADKDTLLLTFTMPDFTLPEIAAHRKEAAVA
jgi:hypothetical protein